MNRNQPRITYKWIVLSVIAVGTLASTIDMGGIRVILPNLEHVFHTSPDVVVWVSLIWVLLGSGFMLSMGRASDILGRKRLYTAGMIIFTVGLILCSISRSIVQLIIFRFIQAFGAAITISIANAILTSAFPDTQRGKALGILGAIGGLGMLSGPAIAGLCLDLLGWRSFFYLRTVIGVTGVLMSHFLLKEQSTRKNGEKFDLPGASTLFVSLTCLLLAMTQGQNAGWTSPLILLLAGFGSLLFFVSFL